MKAILKIINSHFWKSGTGPFFAFIFPIIFIAILSTLLGYDQLFGSIIAIPVTTIGLVVLPISLFEFKNSSLLKRIGVTPIKPWMFIFSISIYYVLIMVVATVSTFLIGLLILIKYMDNGRVILNSPIKIIAPSLLEFLKNVNYVGLIWGLLMNIMVSASIGLFVSTVCKSTLSIQAIGVPILIISQFLSAQVLPIAMVREVDVLYYMSYLTPFKYPTGIIINSWNPIFDDLSNLSSLLESPIPTPEVTIKVLGVSSVFDVNKTFYTLNSQGKNIAIFYNYDKILNLIMPFIFSIGFALLTLKTFKWSVR